MKISFIIPLHNEEKNAQAVVERILKYGKSKKWNFEVIPVDDRSTDQTGNILKKLSRQYSSVKPLIRKADGEQKGNTMGITLVEGTRKSTGDIIIWTMGDLADDPQTYGKIVEKIRGNFDMVFGSRYIPGGSRGNLDVLKAFLSSRGTKLAGFLFGISTHDITNAFRGFKKSVFDSIILESPGFSVSPEFAIKAHLGGFRLGEVPTVYTNRIEGVSNFKLYKMTKSYLMLYFSLFYRYKILKKSPNLVKSFEES